ncbi:hypothetical protein OQ968_02025 [Mycobacterium sp. 663a-19]|uniref:cupin domain-containing protein n=1 Tax=Mycobacterium sp. 663a-19 TaxID=2986148 RepID=UPI002D1E6A23|nr:hypothetical protein [Mycobacterium sp. 663a-19]MEB3980039.1 hypothetical protein [Mycobacterium sp. 663a-19]
MADNQLDKLTAAPLPRIPTETNVDSGVPGVEWNLDSNVVVLAPDGGIDTHTGADVDVLIHVLSGSGRLITEQGAIELAPGSFAWLPRRSQLQFTAGPSGLRYLTVQQKREILPVTPTARYAV